MRVIFSPGQTAAITGKVTAGTGLTVILKLDGDLETHDWLYVPVVTTDPVPVCVAVAFTLIFAVLLALVVLAATVKVGKVAVHGEAEVVTELVLIFKSAAAPLTTSEIVQSYWLMVKPEVAESVIAGLIVVSGYVPSEQRNISISVNADTTGA